MGYPAFGDGVFGLVDIVAHVDDGVVLALDNLETVHLEGEAVGFGEGTVAGSHGVDVADDAVGLGDVGKAHGTAFEDGVALLINARQAVVVADVAVLHFDKLFEVVDEVFGIGEIVESGHGVDVVGHFLIGAGGFFEIGVEEAGNALVGKTPGF